MNASTCMHKLRRNFYLFSSAWRILKVTPTAEKCMWTQITGSQTVSCRIVLSAPKRLQSPDTPVPCPLPLQKFDIVVSYKKGEEMHIADTLNTLKYIYFFEQ